MVQILDRSGHPTVIFNYWAQRCPGVECLKTDAVIEKTAKNVKLQLKAMALCLQRVAMFNFILVTTN